jgi:hypothetical protein
MIGGFNSYQPIHGRQPGGGPHLSCQVDGRDDSLVSLWGDKAMAWSARNGLGEAADRLIGLSMPALPITESPLFNETGFQFEPPASTMTYSNLFKLADKPLAWQELSWDNYTKRVHKNFSRLVKALRPENRGSFFQGVTLQSYLKEVVWEGNIKPIKDFANGKKKMSHCGQHILSHVAA